MNTTIQNRTVPAVPRGFYLNRVLSAATAVMLTIVWLAAAQPSQAGEVGISTTKVAYGDLNLQTEAGARTLYRRLQAAAAGVCGVAEHRDLGRWLDWRQCYQKALMDAVDGIGAPTLLAVHRRSVGGAASSG